MIIETNLGNTLPRIEFDEIKGTLLIKGRSIYNTPEKFYNELIDYIKVYAHYPTDLTVTMDIEYFNTKTSKCFMDLFEICLKVKKKGAKLTINWLVDEDDQDMIDAGQDYQYLIDASFNIIYHKSENEI